MSADGGNYTGPYLRVALVPRVRAVARYRCPVHGAEAPFTFPPRPVHLWGEAPPAPAGERALSAEEAAELRERLRGQRSLDGGPEPEPHVVLRTDVVCRHCGASAESRLHYEQVWLEPQADGLAGLWSPDAGFAREPGWSRWIPRDPAPFLGQGDPEERCRRFAEAFAPAIAHVRQRLGLEAVVVLGTVAYSA